MLLRNEHEITLSNVGRIFGDSIGRYRRRESRRQAPVDGFTAFLDWHTPHPKIGETAQTGNCWDVFTASCQASHRISTKLTISESYFVHIP
ncbi:hypothetical protein EQU24_05125 [Methylotuvimicrobium buryatense]|uniref:Uncharacterized protein n=1 Tax=Methylotuvimicrobium buryatense TaxID=95641 RepID=A0A4P9UKU1_METBY|nr:hypothetical protein EQU24_05125 [Methylotuvimicrobium buryatense]